MATATLPRLQNLTSLFVIIVIILCYPTVAGIPNITGSIHTTSQSTTLARCQSAYKNLTKGRLARYIDASGKPGSGIYGGNNLWYGSYSECSKLSDSRYCWTAFVGTISLVTNESKTNIIEWGVCMPDVCTDEDVIENFQFLFKNVSNIKIVTPFTKTLTVSCAEDPEYTTSVIITIIFCVLLVVVCLLATIVDGLKMRYKGEIVDESNHIPLDKEAEEKTPLLTKGTIKLVQEKSTFNDVFHSFSIIRNVNSIMNTDVGNRDLTYLHGIRVLSLFWIILIHVNSFSFNEWPIDNFDDMVKFQQRWETTIAQSAYGVDTFFLLSGLLLMYTNINKKEKSNGNTNWLKYYAHRYLRLTPTLMFCVLLVATLPPFFGAGPVWFIKVETSACSENWWTNLLYVNNFVDQSKLIHACTVIVFTREHFLSKKEMPIKLTRLKLCIGPTWYLAADMQMFLVSPIFLVIAYRYGLRPLIYAVGTTIFGCIIVTASIIAANDYPPIPEVSPKLKTEANQWSDAQEDVYEKPYCRMAVYVMGIALGYVLHKYSTKKFNFSRKIVLVLWILAVVLALTDVYVIYTATKEDPYVWTTGESALYWSLKWPTWGLCIFWLIFACHYNYAGPVKEILEARFWIPLSRVNYAAYVIHWIILKILILNIETPFHFTAFTLTTYYLSSLVLVYAVAFVITVMVELPCANMEVYIWKKLEGKK